MKKYYIISQIVVSLIAFFILISAFFNNNFFAKIIISPFLICSASVFLENLFLLLNQYKKAKVCRYIYRISFLSYFCLFLLYVIYYIIVNKNYLNLIVVGIFILALIHFFKK